MLEFTKGIVCGHPGLEKAAQNRSMKEITALEKKHEAALKKIVALEKKIDALENPELGKNILFWYAEGKHYLEPVNEVIRKLRAHAKSKSPKGHRLRVTVDWGKDWWYQDFEKKAKKNKIKMPEPE